METRKTKMAVIAVLMALAGLLWIPIFATAGASEPNEKVQKVKQDF